MKYYTAIITALLLGIGAAQADFTTGMLARWTFNDISSEQAALTDDSGKFSLQKGVSGKDAAFSINPDGSVTLGGAVYLVAAAVHSDSATFGRLAEGGTIYCRIKYLDHPECAFNFGLMNSVRPGNWPELICNVLYTPKGLAMRAKGPGKLEAGMSSGHLPVKKDGYSDAAIVFNGKTRKLQLFVDGKTAERNAPMSALDHFQSLMLGRLKASNAQRIQLDEVRIYGTPLSAEWIAEIEPVKKNAAAGKPTAGPGGSDRLIVEDFSDVGTWRTWTLDNITAGKWFAADLVLGATPDASRDDGYAGKLQFDFASANRTGRIDFQRAKASLAEVFADGVEFDADPRGVRAEIRFALEDSNGKRFTTEPVTLSGQGWKRYRSSVGRQAERFTPPFKLYKIVFASTGTSGAGYLLIDDLALTGGVSRQRQVTVRPVLAPLATEPGRPGQAVYRFRNASAQPVEGEVSYRLFDWDDREIMTRSFPLKIAARGQALLEVPLPALNIGSYHAECEFASGKLRHHYTDWIAVFRPNHGRKNTRPMWFGIQDTDIWNCDAENDLHRKWKKMAGFDLERFGMTGARVDVGNATNFPAVRRYLQANQDQNILTCFSYTMGAPAYTQDKPDYNGAPTRLDPFRRHMDKVFACIKPFPSVRYLEFWNEPDVDFYHGTFDEYLAALRVVNESRNATAPEIKITSGGVTVRHPREKKDFSRDMYIRGKGLYDLACFHAHGSLLNYSERQEMVENWLRTAGVEVPVCNTETGDRSGYTVPTIKRQAATLARKIVYAKSRNTEFYVWFTLQDYWDMDPQADDSFGLVTSDNRPKPSFVAYNELIRQLGDTGRGERLKHTGGLEIYRFRSLDGKREVLALWPATAGNRQILPLEGHGEITAVDLLGRAIPAEVKYGYASIPVTDATYISYPAGAFRYGTAIAAQKNPVGGSAGADVPITVAVRNPFPEAARIEIGARTRELRPGETADLTVTLRLPEHAPNGTFAAEREVRFAAGNKQLKLTVPLTVNVSYSVAAGTRPTERLAINSLNQVHEMSFDPKIPRWMGPKDLSAEFAMTHEDGKLKLDIRVTDDKHVMTHAPADAWRDDSIQVGFAAIDGRFTEVTISGRDGKGAVYCHISPDPSFRRQWQVPVRFSRSNGVTRYEVELPLRDLGIADRAGTAFRFAFLVNENDGLGRVRWIEWKSGIGYTKNPDEFGWGMLK